MNYYILEKNNTSIKLVSNQIEPKQINDIVTIIMEKDCKKNEIRNIKLITGYQISLQIEAK